MPLIKRYPNRKLYDTEAKQYITLDGIADQIRQGKEISVIDHASGEDLTTLTLTQIIVDQEKKQSGLLPRAVLAGLIQAGGDGLNALQRTFSTPLNLLSQFDDEVRKRIQDLVKRGELSEGEGQNLVEKLVSQNPLASRGQAIIDAEIEKIITRHELPTNQDLQKIQQQLEELSTKLEQINT